jgi:hypothetical protein
MITYFPTFRPPTPEPSSSSSSSETKARLGPLSPKREFVFLVDCSGSMAGVSITQARSALQAFLEVLPKKEEGVYFNIIKFGSNHSSLFITSAPCSKENIDIAEKYIQALDANMGGTELLGPLQFILNPETSNFGPFSFSSSSSSPSKPSHPRQVFVLTDGEITNTEAVFGCIRQHRGTTRVFSFGIGSNPSRHLVLGMARAGDGKAEFVIPGEQLTVKVLRQMEQSLQPSLTNLSVDWHPERRDCLFVQAPCRLGTLYPKSRLIVYALFDSCPNGLENARVTLNFNNQPIVLPTFIKYQESSSGTIPLIHTLTARSIIREMEEKCSQFHDDNGVILATCLQYPSDTPDSFVKRQIVALGQSYNLASSKTSFVAVVEE